MCAGDRRGAPGADLLPAATATCVPSVHARGRGTRVPSTAARLRPCWPPRRSRSRPGCAWRGSPTSCCGPVPLEPPRRGGRGRQARPPVRCCWRAGSRSPGARNRARPRGGAAVRRGGAARRRGLGRGGVAGPEASRRKPFPSTPGMDIRYAEGSIAELGPAAAWPQRETGSSIVEPGVRRSRWRARLRLRQRRLPHRRLRGLLVRQHRPHRLRWCAEPVAGWCCSTRLEPTGVVALVDPTTSRARSGSGTDVVRRAALTARRERGGEAGGGPGRRGSALRETPTCSGCAICPRGAGRRPCRSNRRWRAVTVR